MRISRARVWLQAFSAAAIAMVLSGCFWSGPSAEDVKVAEAEYGLANDAFHRGNLRAALDHVNTALDRDETNTDAAYLGAMVMLMFCAQEEGSPDCRYEEAEKYVRRALEVKPDLRDARNVLGVILVHQDRPTEAVKILEPLAHDMLYRSPEKAWGNLGWALLEAGQVDDAIPALERAVASQPLFCVGHYRLGLAYEKKGELQAARRAFTRAVSIEEGGCKRLQAAFFARGRVAKRLGAADDARRDFERCREVGTSTDVGRSCAAALAP